MTARAGLLAAGLAAAALAVGWVGDSGSQYLLALVLIWCIFALGFDLVFGVAGMISFGHAAFFGVGAYAYAILTLDHDLPGLPALILAAAAGGLLGLAFGATTFRVRGIYLALTTLVLAQFVHHLIEVKLRDVTGGTDGLVGVPRPELLGIDLYDEFNYLAFVAVLFGLSLAALAIVRASPFGQVLAAIRQNETRVQQLGYDPRLFKLAAFGLSGAFSGLAGGLLGALMMFVGPDMTRWNTSGDVLIMTVLGGRGTLLGPVVGVVLFEWLKESASSLSDHWYGILGLIFILVTLYLPGGVVGLANRTLFRRAEARRLARLP